MNGLLSLNPRLRTQGPNVVNALLLGQQMKGQREDRAFRKRLFEREETKFGWEEEDRAGKLEAQKLERKKAIQGLKNDELTFNSNLLSYGMKWLPEVAWDPQNQDYGAFKQHMTKMGMDPSLLPDSFESKEEFNTWKNRTRSVGTTLSQEYDAELKKRKLAEPGFEEKEAIRAKHREPKGALTEAQKLTQYQRLRNDVAKKWGYSEFSKLDEDTAQKVEEATVLAREYYEADPKKNMDATIMRANSEVRGKHEAVDAIPRANKGRVWNNIQETQESIKPLLIQGMKTSEVLELLIGRGWEREEAIEIIRDAASSIQ